jgi:hypothetical protein
MVRERLLMEASVSFLMRPLRWKRNACRRASAGERLVFRWLDEGPDLLHEGRSEIPLAVQVERLLVELVAPRFARALGRGVSLALL